mmetsp:Transcript_48848/g.147179  ORF Transcript_48848/g.147179 Transcript_48848/m.147179 type:complete len:1011 (-) Transcript_48848:184-3216(-)
MTLVPPSFRSQHSGSVLAGDPPSKSSALRTQGASGRLPLRPRNANVENRIRGTPSSVSSGTGMLVKQQSSSSLRSSGAASSTTGGSGKYSYLVDSSGNECNRRVVSGGASTNTTGTSLSSAAFASSTLRKLDGGIDPCSDTSTVAETGQKIAANILGAKSATGGGTLPSAVRSASPAPSAAMSSASASTTSEGTKAGGGRSRSQLKSRSLSAQRSAAPPSSSARSSSVDPSGKAGSADEVVIEERRRSSSGDGYTIHKYVRGRMLGKGGFAKVYHCTSMDTGRHYAVKIVPKANLVKSRARQKLQAEIKIHRTLRHKYICEFKHFFEDKTNCYILLELCANQSMNELIKRRKRLTETEVQYYMLHLIDAVKYMHDRNVIHRDLKLGNLFLDKNLQVKVGDLGLATKVTSSEEKRKTICGTPNYIAPEVIDGNKETRGHSFEVDIWSMGVILFTTLVGKPPYESKDVKSTYQRILANQYSFPSHVPISQHAKDLIASMLQTRPEKRPSLNQIRSHPFLSRVEDKLPKTLPSNCAHVAPDWQEDAYGNLTVVERGSGRENFSRHTASSSSRHKKYREESAAPIAPRQPLTTRDTNVEAAEKRGGPSEKQHKKDGAQGTRHTSSRGSSGRDVEKGTDARQAQRGASSAPRAKSTQKFRIYDDSGGTEVVQEKAAGGIPPPSKTRHDKPPQCSPQDEMLDDLASKVSACTLWEKEPTKKAENLLHQVDTPSAAAETSKAKEVPSTPADEKDRDMVVLESMYTRLTDMFKQADKKAAGLDEVSLFDRTTAAGVSTAFGVNANWGATKWVTRYVDYTSKYGLGFLLNNGSAGVYFNDSTKAVLAPKGDNFMYIERKKTSSDGRLENMCEIHTLSSYPESLQKKVTLLKHFRNYLVEQQKRAVEEGEEKQDAFGASLDLEAGEETEIDNTALVYLKKWVRTKHAILFRLSNSTVQVVFYDHTEILLSSEARVITYVDKKHRRITYHLDEIMMTPNAEISKRLKYTKDILQQLIPGKH